MVLVDPPSPGIVTKMMLVPSGNVFANAQPGSALVLHKTAGWPGASAEDIATMFSQATDKRSAHFVVGQDGEVVQCVHVVDGAGANCCVEPGSDPFWNPLLQQFGNLNLCTISIEHVDPASDNSTPLTPAQQAASFKLIEWLVVQYGFDARPDGKGQMLEIKGHDSIDPQSRARCPGNFPWPALITFLNGGQTMDKSAQQFQDVWTASGQRVGTGIYQALLGNRKNLNLCYPTSAEITTTDWNGSPIVYQAFGYYHVEYGKLDGRTRVYSATNNLIATL